MDPAMPLQANLIRLRNLLERQQSLTERGVPMSLLARPQDSMEDMIEQVLVGTIHWILEAVPDKFYKVSSSVKGPIWRFEGEGASGMGYDGTVTITYTIPDDWWCAARQPRSLGRGGRPVAPLEELNAPSERTRQGGPTLEPASRTIAQRPRRALAAVL